MSITMKFTNRDRYRRAINHLWAHPEKYEVKSRGKDYGMSAKDRAFGWYVEFCRVETV
jgi:hypothetical protein